MSKTVQEKVKSRILIPLAFSLVFILLAFILNTYWYHKEKINRESRESMQSVQKLFKQRLDLDVEMISNIIENISDDDRLKSAWLKKDRSLLYELSRPIYKKMLENHGITDFYFRDVNRVNFLRVYNPEAYGDVINRFTQLKAEELQKPFSGIELGKFGRFDLRVVHPWFINGELTGYIELGKGIEHIIKQMSDILGIELYVIVYKKFLVRKNWELGNKLLDRDENWDLLPDVVITGHTIDEISKKLIELLHTEKHVYEESADIEIPINRRIYNIRFIPLYDAGKREVGDIIVLKDVTESLAAFRKTLLVASAVCFAVALVLFIIFYLILNKVERQLESSRISLHKAKNDLEERVKERTYELQQINKELVESEERFRSVTQSASDAIISADSEGKIISWNNGARQIFGYEEEEILGEPLTILMPERYRDVHRKGFARFISTGKAKVLGKTVELEGLRKDGSEFPIELSIASWKMDKGMFFSAIIRDITERKKTEEAIRESEEKFRALFEESRDAIYISSLEGKFIDANKFALDLFGYTKEEMMGMDALKIYVNPSDRKEFQREIEQKGFVRDYEIMFKKKDGIRMECLISSTVRLDKDGNVLGYQGIIRDVSERKRSERALEQSSRKLVESQENERRRIASELHDGLVYNLFLIKSGINKCLKMFTGKNETTKFLDQVAQTAQQSIDEVREVAYDLHPHQLEKLGLKGALESTINKATRSFGMKFHATIHEIDNLLQKNQEIHLYRIVQEAVNNIVKHSGARETTIYIGKNDDYLYIDISDNGKGFSADPQNMKYPKSKGLGLEGIWERARILKGSCDIESSLGKGTNIKIKIPIRVGK